MGLNLVTRRRVGNLVWGMGAFVALVWGGLRNASYEARGMGFAPPVAVASLEAGRIAGFDVALHEEVSAEKVLVRMDSSVLDEEREVISAQLLAVQQEQADAAANEARRFAEGIEGILLDHARLAAAIQEDSALARSLQEQLDIERGLAGSGASSGQQVRTWERELDVVRARLEASRVAFAVADAAVRDARTRADGRPEANEWAVVAATRALEQVEGRISRLQLSAGIDGQVTAIYRSPGEVVAAGEPVLEVTRLGTSEVLAWLPTAAIDRALSGSRASVVRSSGQVLRGHLVSVGSGPQQMPPQLWMNPAYPEWGLPVRIQLANGEVGPSEPVTVRI